jgi:hypothetical protein
MDFLACQDGESEPGVLPRELDVSAEAVDYFLGESSEFHHHFLIRCEKEQVLKEEVIKGEFQVG